MVFDVSKCIDRHNAVVSQIRSHPRHQSQIQRSWFVAHQIDPLEFESLTGFDIGNDLRVFLESIDIVLPHEHQSATFTPFLAGISNPKDLRPDDWEGLDEDFILLYRNTDTDPGGLVMSRSTQQVGYVRDYFDDPRECLWADLHVVLDLYLRCINSGKFVLDEDCPSYIFDEFTHDELTSTLAMWDNLVAAIVARLPTQANNETFPTADYGEGLISASVLAMYPAIPRFARAFLSQAKRPLFTSIAP
jgi:hypothetical protein